LPVSPNLVRGVLRLCARGEQMTGDLSPGSHVDRRGGSVAADIHGVRATRMEMTAARRIRRGGDLAGQLGESDAHRRSGNRRGRAERLRIGMTRRVKDLRDWPDLDDASEIHDGDPLTKLPDDAEVVRDEKKAQSTRLFQAPQHREDLRLDGHVERGDGFVGDDQLRLEHQGARDGNALALTAGEFVREFVEGLRRHADLVEHAKHSVACLGAGTFAMDEKRLDEGFAHRTTRIERRVRILEYDLDALTQFLHCRGWSSAHLRSAEAQRPCIRLDQAKDATTDRCLSAARLPDQPEGFTGLDVERNAVDRTHAERGTIE